MKAFRFILIFAPLLLTACSTATIAGKGHPPETVLITYHVKQGKEANLKEALSRAWEIYRQKHLVFAQPHIIVRDTEEGDKVRFVEIFTWISSATPENAPDVVQTVWGQEQSLCEARSKHDGIQIDEVELLIPSHAQP